MKQSAVLFVLLFLLACSKYRPPAEHSNFPPDVQIIFTNKCATTGCHNDKSFENAEGLNISSWESLFAGSENGSPVIPFNTAQSSLLMFINTYQDLGLTAIPTMPLNDHPLSREEVMTIKNWIQKGCPNAQGGIPFADHAETRSKIYITNQGCDLVSIIDAESKVVMRCIKVGHDPVLVESPHNIRMSADGKYWYVCFSNGFYLQKYDAVNDTLVAETNLGSGVWSMIRITSDDKTALITDLSNNGKLKEVDLESMNVTQTFSGVFSKPHGIVFTQTGDTVYITAQYGNLIYRFIRSIPQITEISLQKGIPPSLISSLDPHEIVMSPDFSKYFISCEASNEIRVMDAKTDTLLKIIPVGAFPLEMVISEKKQQLFVSCQEDENTIFPFFKGSVCVIDLNTLTLTKKISEKFYQPHGIAVDDNRDLLYVSSRNINPSGPAPHHTSECAGRNGFYHVIDLNTWQPMISNSEISVDPYSMEIRK